MTDYEKKFISRTICIRILDERKICFIISGLDITDYGTFLIIFLDPDTKTYTVRKWLPLTPIINDFGDNDKISSAYKNYDFLIELNENTNLNFDSTTKNIDITFYAFMINNQPVNVEPIIIRGSTLFTDKYTTLLNKKLVEGIPNRNYTARRYRNFLINTRPLDVDTNTTYTPSSYSAYNGSNKENTDIKELNKIIGFDQQDFYISSDIFIEIGSSEIEPDDNKVYINFALNQRDKNDIYAYTQTYSNLQYTLDPIAGLEFRVLNPPPNNELEVIKLIIDFRLRNSNKKQEKVKVQKKKKVKDIKKIKTGVKDVLSGELEPLEVLQDVFNLI